jgi:glycosyltransferase involved in cell wall biosynthesis
MGHEVEVIGPDRFRTLPCPTYPEIRLSVLPGRKLARLIQMIDPDYLHVATEGPLGMAARSWAKARGLRFTTSFHTRFAEYIQARTRIPASFIYPFLRRFHGAGAGVMVATASLREELQARGFTNVRAWTRGVDLDLFHPPAPDAPREDWGLERPIFAYVGRVAVEKNIGAFLGLDLPGSKVVVGGGPQTDQLRRDFPGATFAGPLFGAELARAYGGADVFVFPSRTDTFGLVMLESLACGTPVAAYPVTGPKDVLTDADGPVGAVDADLRAAAIRALDGDRAACRLHAERFSWRACAELFLHHLTPMRPEAAVDKQASGAAMETAGA